MSHVLGIGGVFIRSQNQAALVAWYEKHFGLKADPASNTFNLSWAEGAAALPKGLSVLAPFAQDTDYFRASRSKRRSRSTTSEPSRGSKTLTAAPSNCGSRADKPCVAGFQS
jgi:hypothetical protein